MIPTGSSGYAKKHQNTFAAVSVIIILILFIQSTRDHWHYKTQFVLAAVSIKNDLLKESVDRVVREKTMAAMISPLVTSIFLRLCDKQLKEVY